MSRGGRNEDARKEVIKEIRNDVNKEGVKEVCKEETSTEQHKNSKVKVKYINKTKEQEKK